MSASRVLLLRVQVIGAGVLLAALLGVAILARFNYHAGVVRRIEAGVDGSTSLAIVTGVTGRFAAVLDETPTLGALLILHGEPSMTPKGDLVLLRATAVTAIGSAVWAPLLRWPDGVHALFAAHRLVALVVGLALLALNDKAVNVTSTLVLGAALSLLVGWLANWIIRALGFEPSPAVAAIGAVLLVAGSFALAQRYGDVRQALLGRIAIALLTLPLSREMAATGGPMPLIALLVGACVPLILPRAAIWIVGAWLVAVGVGVV